MSAKMTPPPLLVAEPIGSVVEALRDRCSWPLMKQQLARRHLKPGAGWPDFEARANKGDNDAATINTLARKAYSDIVFAGDRYVQVYDLEPGVVQAIWQRISTGTVSPSVFSSRYPLPLKGAALDTAPSDFTLCEWRQTSSSGDVQFVFCSKQVIEERLVIDGISTPTVMSTFSQTLGGYDKFVAYKYKAIQTFDIVSLRPKLGRLELSLDISQRSADFDGNVRALHLLGAVTSHVPELRPLYEGQQPNNLFPSIMEIYKAGTSNDTNIVDIGFRTPSGCINRGKMPSVSDIRREDFHQGGADRVGHQINPYGIVVAWNFSFPIGGAKVKIWTTAAKAAISNPAVPWMEVMDIAADSDMIQAVNKVMSYL